MGETPKCRSRLPLKDIYSGILKSMLQPQPVILVPVEMLSALGMQIPVTTLAFQQGCEYV